jgi:hypothetical protein
MGLIRKISIGPDYKTAMHYSVGQEVYGRNIIVDILQQDDGSFVIMIEKNEEVKVWKTFNKNVAISTEDNIDFG